jgi:hypothetical protein
MQNRSWRVLLIFLTTAFTLSCGQVKFGTKDSSAAPPGGSPNDTGGGGVGGGGGTGGGATTYRDVNYSGLVQTKTNKVDILLVIDDSNSMLADNQKLAARLSSFVSNLQSSSIDWQMCLTLTRQINIGGSLYWGASVNWQSYSPAGGTPTWVLKAGTPNLSTIFNSTINWIGAGWAGTDDERGIKAAHWHVTNSPYNSCYRNDASFSTIVVSDEDVRSVGGNSSLQYYANEFKPLEADDYPQAFVDKVKATLGNQKRFSFNSIIVKNNDSSCMAAQDAQGAKSHYGTLYQSLSGMTGGGVGSICDNDYSANLNYFKDIIQSTLSSLVLECAPYGGVSVTVTPPMGNVATAIQGMNLVFTPEIPAGRTVNVSYKCAVTSSAMNDSSSSRTPSSENEMGMLSKLYNWIVAPILNLFK